MYAAGFHRLAPLRFFELIARVPGVRLYILQKNDGVEQLAQVADKFEVSELASRTTSKLALSWTPRRCGPAWTCSSLRTRW